MYNIKNLFRRKRNITPNEKNINSDQLKKMLQNGAILIDVRSPQEYNEGHLENSILLPEYEIIKEIKNIECDKNKTIILYCSSGRRSKKAQKELQNLGYTDVYNLYNGIQNYCDF